jgi:hypothetical protein
MWRPAGVWSAQQPQRECLGGCGWCAGQSMTGAAVRQPAAKTCFELCGAQPRALATSRAFGQMQPCDTTPVMQPQPWRPLLIIHPPLPPTESAPDSGAATRAASIF